jgi:hypothetical protein
MTPLGFLRSFRFPASILWALCLIAPALVAAAQEPPAATPPVQLPPVEVTGSRILPHDINSTFEKMNHLFDGPFPSLRSGPMIEAILWRHRFLDKHPGEQALIVTTERGGRIRSATTVYTLDGKVFCSSNSLGERQSIPGFVAADLKGPDGIARARKFIVDLRKRYSAGTSFQTDPGDSVPDPVLGTFLVRAEESGDYWQAANIPVDLEGGANNPGTLAMNPYDLWRRAQQVGTVALTGARFDAFSEPAPEVLSWTYQALHSPERAGVVPVTLTLLSGKFPRTNPRGAAPIENPQVLIFDWEGVHYFYHPDIGTWSRPLPPNPLTGLPYLCVKNGGLLECAYFCATYTRIHPGTKTALLPDDPVMAAYPSGEKLGLFIPSFGRFTLSKDYLDALDDPASLAQLRDQLIAMQKDQKVAPNVLPEGMPGDDRDLQVRRAFLAFQAAGVPCQLHEDHGASLDFTWNGVAYTYGPDPAVHSGLAGAP